MTDNEIIKALECCCIAKLKADCKKLECPFYNDEIGNCNYIDNEEAIYKATLDLINRQQAEIERLTDRCSDCCMLKAKNEIIHKLKEQIGGWQKGYCDIKQEIKTAKTEAIKDVVEKLRKHIEALEYNLNTPRKTVPVQTLYDQVNWILKEVIPQTIDGVLKELEGDAE